jgi:S1-C subfamily serine protease
MNLANHVRNRFSWLAVLLACGLASATGLAAWQDPQESVDTITEAENVPREAETAPADAQDLPPESAIEDPQGLKATGAHLGVELDPRQQRSATVTRVAENSPAAKAGLQPGDRIFAVNKEPVTSPMQLVQLIRRLQPGQVIEIQYQRAMRVEVPLGRRDTAK